MNALFSALLKRMNPAARRRSKPFLQYIMIYSRMARQSRISDFLFADSDQDDLDQCLKGGFTKSFVSKLIESASTIKQQVVARCAGLVHVVEAQHWTVEPNDQDFRTSYCGPTGEDLDLSSLEAISHYRVEFIHRTARTFLEDDPEGQSFLRSCSLPEVKAHLNLLRANVARTALGIDHILTTYRSGEYIEDWVESVLQLSSVLESFPNTHTQYHILTEQLVNKLRADLRQTQDPATDDSSALMSKFRRAVWSPTIPIESSLRIVYASIPIHPLVSYIKFCAQRFDMRERRMAVITIWCTLARDSVSMDKAGIYLGLLSELHTLCRSEPVTGLTICEDIRYNLVAAFLRISGQPLWMILLGFLLHHKLEGNLELSSAAIHAFLDSFACSDIPTAEPFELTVIANQIRDIILITAGSPEVIERDLTSLQELTIRCTIGGIISLLLPGQGYPQCGVSGFGDLPYLVRWRPSYVKRVFEVRADPETPMWQFVKGSYRLNKDFSVELTPHDLDTLREDEMADLRELHKEISQRRFRCFV
jgi:hypothetical protein